MEAGEGRKEGKTEKVSEGRKEEEEEKTERESREDYTSNPYHTPHSMPHLNSCTRPALYCATDKMTFNPCITVVRGLSRDVT